MAAAVEIPKKAKAAVYDKPGTLSTAITELDVPEPGPNQVLIRLTHSGGTSRLTSPPSTLLAR